MAPSRPGRPEDYTYNTDFWKERVGIERWYAPPSSNAVLGLRAVVSVGRPIGANGYQSTAMLTQSSKRKSCRAILRQKRSCVALIP